MKKDEIANKLEKHLPVANRIPPPPVVKPSDIQSDYDFSRETLKQLINTGMHSLDALAELARESEHPRAFEVLSKSIKDIGDVTDKLMSLQKATKELTTDSKNSPESTNVTNNNLFVGSTTDLQRMLIDSQKKIIDADD